MANRSGASLVQDSRLAAESSPFADLDERAAARSARLRVLRRMRRHNIPRSQSTSDLIRVRASGPLAAEWEHVEKTPVVEVEWPAAVKAARRRIDASLGAKLLADTAALARSYDAFLMADLELARDIDSFADPRSAWLHHPRHEEYLGRALQQLAHNLQNYVAAAGALIDHARRFRRRYAPAGTPNGNAYDQRIKATFGGPEGIIVEYLRNYALHHSLPLVVGQQQEVTAEGWPTLILLDTVSLLDGDGSAGEKELLKKWAGGIPMAPLIGMYSSRVVAFYSWLASRLRPWYREADQELEELNRDLQRALDDAGLGDLPSLIDQLEQRHRRER